jgi:hypothetical protein
VTDCGRVDFEAVIASLDLTAMVRMDAPRERGGRFGCPWHSSASGTSTPLTVHVDPAGRQRWRCWSCGATGDALDWIVRRSGGTRLDVARSVLGITTSTPVARPPGDSVDVPARPVASPTWRNPDWQAAVDAVVTVAASALWSPGGREALDYLRGRGLGAATISRFRLGFVARTHRLDVEGLDKPVRVHGPGISIPWAAPDGSYDVGAWVGMNVRRLDWRPGEPNKYVCATGSQRGHLYPFGEITPGVTCLILEGEFDSLLAWQEAGWIASTVTVGSANQTPRPEALESLAAAPNWLVLPDNDAAGAGAAARWESLDPERAIPVRLPRGKDLTEFVQGGGDVPTWLAAEYQGLGWPLPRSLEGKAAVGREGS